MLTNTHSKKIHGAFLRIRDALVSRGYDWRQIFQDGLSKQDIATNVTSLAYPDWVCDIFEIMDGEKWYSGGSELLLIPFYVINPLSVAIQVSEIISQFDELLYSRAKIFIPISSESAMDHMYIDLNEYDGEKTGFVYGFGPGFASSERVILFDNIFSCLHIIGESIENGITPCQWPGTEEKYKDFSDLVKKRSLHQNYW